MRTCATCGTEVDADGTFCPSCGQPLVVAASDASDPPRAPAWGTERAEDAPRGQPTAAWSRTDPAGSESTAPPSFDVPREAAQPRAAASVPPSAMDGPSAAEDRGAGGPTQVNVPLTWPVTMSGWLIGVGAFVGALSLLLDFRLFANPVTIVLLVLLLGASASIFLAARLPAIAHLRLIVLGTVFVALGVALDRVGFGGGAASAVLLLAMIAAAAGVVMTETGRDRPWAGPAGAG